MSLGRWQPDIVCISFAKKKIAIGPEVILPSDSRMAALQQRPIVGRLSPMAR